MKEKNVLAERLKNAELARKRFDEELKRFATETVTREEVRQSLEDEVRRLTQTVGQTEGGLREKEEQVMRCEAYIDGMEAKLHACQVCSLSALPSPSSLPVLPLRVVKMSFKSYCRKGFVGLTRNPKLGLDLLLEHMSRNAVL